MRTIVGDLWEQGGWHVVPTNLSVCAAAQAVMGRGVARQAADTWPRLAAEYGTRLRQGRGGFELFREYHVICFPVKRHFTDDADIDLICESAMRLDGAAWALFPEEIMMPLPGAGVGDLADKADEIRAAVSYRIYAPNVTLVLRSDGVRQKYPASFGDGTKTDHS